MVLESGSFVAVLAVIAALAAWYLLNGGPIMAYLAILGAAWLLFATLREWALRIRLFEVSLAESARRVRNLPRASHGMTLAHAGVAVLMMGMIGSTGWKSEEI